MSKPAARLQGTLDLLILEVPAQQPMYGWAIGQRLKQTSDEVLQVSSGSLYLSLHKNGKVLEMVLKPLQASD